MALRYRPGQLSPVMPSCMVRRNEYQRNLER